MRHSFNLKTLAIAITALSATGVASGAGLDRSGQDTTAFFQDGTYFEATYSYIDADVTGRDSSGNKIDDIAEDYDFFRYGVKTDINDTFSVGVLYDEPWGAAADYVGDNDFIGTANKVGAGAVQQIAGGALVKTNKAIEEVSVAIASSTDPVDKFLYNQTLQGLNNSKANFESLINQPSVSKFNDAIAQTEQAITKSEAYLNSPAANSLTPKQRALANGLVAQNKQSLAQIEQARNVVQDMLNINEETQVEVRTQSITGLVGAKFGTNNEFQVYGGPVAQRLKAEVHLRGDAYESATGYDLSFNPAVDYGWIAGLQYSKPEIALKASLTYRSEIDHEVDAAETFPLVALNGIDPVQTNNMEITTPKSVNFDFQTGINPTTLATARVRWVPWSDFAITPPLYNNASLTSGLYGAQGLNLVDYDDDQWVVELGLAKRVLPRLAVSGSVGWDSGAGNPTTSLGPIKGYYSVGAGAKYNLNENWALSAGGKYLMFGDADGQIPSGSIVSDFEDNDGFIAGIKLSYQQK